jgi:hypothetical protein
MPITPLITAAVARKGEAGEGTAARAPNPADSSPALAAAPSSAAPSTWSISTSFNSSIIKNLLSFSIRSLKTKVRQIEKACEYSLHKKNQREPKESRQKIRQLS